MKEEQPKYKDRHGNRVEFDSRDLVDFLDGEITDLEAYFDILTRLSGDVDGNTVGFPGLALVHRAQERLHVFCDAVKETVGKIEVDISSGRSCDNDVVLGVTFTAKGKEE